MARSTDKPLRSGFTTGACAAAAAKAAVRCLLGQMDETVDIPFPDGSRHRFALCRVQPTENGAAMATVVKDAGDDPDVTNGAEIGAEVRWIDPSQQERISLVNGPGVGRVTKPGLPVAVGEPAINPVPRKMIRQAVLEALAASGDTARSLEVKIFVRDGEILAEKTLNRRPAWVSLAVFPSSAPPALSAPSRPRPGPIPSRHRCR